MAATGFIGCFEYDKINTDVIYASELYGGFIYRTINGGTQWVQLSAYPGSPVTDLAADPQNLGVLYAAVGSFGNQEQVFKSVNGGQSWANISANLPPVPANTLVVDPRDSQIIYVGTDLGVWVTEDGGVSWSAFNNGLPYVVVDDIHFYKPDTTIRIGTYGRGYWRTKALPAGSAVHVQEPKSLLAISIYPNPVIAGSTFTLNLFSENEIPGKLSVTFFDGMGKRIAVTKKNIYYGTNKIEVIAPVSPGLYLLNIITGSSNFNFKIAVVD